MSCDHHHHHHGDHHHKYVIIRNPKSGLVLDGSERTPIIQHYTGCDHQLWILEQSDYGRFIIVNKATGNVLDKETGSSVITSKKHGGENQQWYINSDQTIVTSTGNLAIHLSYNDFRPGNYVITYKKIGADYQQWSLQYYCNS